MGSDEHKQDLVLLTGASGYVGGRLLNAFEAEGYHIRCLARKPEFLRPRVGEQTAVVKGDVLDEGSLVKAMQDVHTAYYLVHSMSAPKGFQSRDRRAAENFGRAAKQAGVQRIIYLGGLGSGPDLSPHLASRQEVGRILRDSGVPTVEFRASIIIGSGSLSFEMIRSLVHKLPIMVTPKWVSTLTQPISVEDVIDYLMEAMKIDCPPEGIVYEIGGPQQLSYLGLMQEYAKLRGLRRHMIRVPLLSPRLSSLWLTLFTPLYASIGRQLIDSVRNETTVKDDRAWRDFSVRPRSVREAMERAMTNEDRELAETRWSDALSHSRLTRGWGGVRFGSRLVDSRSVPVPCPPEQAFKPIQHIGGKRGWYFGDPLWQFRGLIDLLIGGVGLRRGRRSPEEVAPGDTIDFWRVEAFEQDRLLRLFAEMKVPGRAWLQFEVDPEPNGGSTIRQTALFDPQGLFGLLYWYMLYPIHTLIFAEMLRRIAQRARS